MPVYFVSDLGVLVHNTSGDNLLHDSLDSLLIKESQIANKLGLTKREVKDAIHIAKNDKIAHANKKVKNPDVGVDSEGEIYIKIGPGEYSADSIGNILDILNKD